MTNSGSAKVIDGVGLAAKIREETLSRATALRAKGRAPCLVAVAIGDDPAAESYARSQAKHAEGVGIDYRLIKLPSGAAASQAAEAIRALNADPAVSGVMVHLPVPAPLDGFQLQQLIAPEKDVEGIAAASLGLLAMDRPGMVPCTAAAAFACLQSTGVDLAGCEAVVVGRSAIVGKPIAMMLLRSHATVTQCHTRTRHPAVHTQRADVLIVAAGKAGLIGAEHVRPGAIVIDVGIHRVPGEGGKVKIVGDVRFDEVAPIASSITPVPGGVGPVTVAMLLKNTVTAAAR